jgi:hypothetical protein
MSPKKTEDSTPQKKGGKAKSKRRLVEDPPVVVGGGNSVDIIFKNTASPVNPPAGRKKFRLPNNITTVVIYDGTNPGTQSVPVSGTFWVEFF